MTVRLLGNVVMGLSNSPADDDFDAFCDVAASSTTIEVKVTVIASADASKGITAATTPPVSSVVESP